MSSRSTCQVHRTPCWSVAITSSHPSGDKSAGRLHSHSLSLRALKPACVYRTRLPFPCQSNTRVHSSSVLSFTIGYARRCVLYDRYYTMFWCACQMPAFTHLECSRDQTKRDTPGRCPPSARALAAPGQAAGARRDPSPLALECTGPNALLATPASVHHSQWLYGHLAIGARRAVRGSVWQKKECQE